MWTPEHYRRLVRASGWYDLLVTAAFVTPWSLMALHGLLQSLHQGLGLPGALPAFEPMHLLLGNLMGSIVCVCCASATRKPCSAAMTRPLACCSPPGRSMRWCTVRRH